MKCRGRVPYCTSCATFPQQNCGSRGERLPGSRRFVEEKWHNCYSTALFLYTESRHRTARYGKTRPENNPVWETKPPL